MKAKNKTIRLEARIRAFHVAASDKNAKAPQGYHKPGSQKKS